MIHWFRKSWWKRTTSLKSLFLSLESLLILPYWIAFGIILKTRRRRLSIITPLHRGGYTLTRVCDWIKNKIFKILGHVALASRLRRFNTYPLSVAIPNIWNCKTKQIQHLPSLNYNTQHLKLWTASNRKLRRLRQNQILVCLCLSLLAAILLFTFGINDVTDSDSLDLCKAMAALLHYFLLSSIVWMSIEAYNLYQDLVKVFDTTLISQNEFMCRAGVVGWSK